MKIIIIVLSMCLIGCCINAIAQDYEIYLQKAYSALTEGKIEVAKSSYNVYKKLTGRTDHDFETLLKDAEVNDWKNSCHIIDLGNGEYLAVQKIDSLQVKLVYDDAKKRCESNHLGGFNDWRLPRESELGTIFNALVLGEHEYFWTSFMYQDPTLYKLTDDIHFTICDYVALKSTGERVAIRRTETYSNGSTNERYEPYGFKKCHYLIIRKFSKSK